MTTRDTAWPTGTPCWVDLMTDDQPAAGQLYAHLFGWDTEPGGDGTYITALKNGRAAAGLMDKTDDSMPAAWTTYLATDDIETTAQAVQEAGGQIYRAPATAGDNGTFAICADPTGAVFGLWQGATHLGFGIFGEPGSIGWNDLMTRDLPTAQRFYQEVFDYRYAPAGPGYVTFATPDGRIVGGMHQADHLPPEAPNHWLVHFAVASRDSSMAMAEMEDDTDILMSLDTPFGPEAVVRGPGGEIFAIIELNPDRPQLE